METPKFFQNNFLSDKTNNNGGASDHFIVDDLLDFSNDDAFISDATMLDSLTENSIDSSTVTVVDSCNSSSLSGGSLNYAVDVASRNITDGHFSGDLCVPYDDLAELEWLSNFVEESFSSEDLQKMQLISGVTTKAPYNTASEARKFHLVQPNRNNPIFNSEVLVPAKARSKRTRGPPCNWASRLLVLSQTTSSSEPDLMVPMAKPATTTIPVIGKKLGKSAPKRKESGDGSGEGRKCMHCSTDKTPQWRTGPMGPKTLCNACGVRYKSGRLVPEYRPAASPTFVLTKHSNSHRKVLELRRQKEIVRVQQHQQQQFLQHHQNMMFDITNCDDYLIHQHTGPNFRQII